MSQYFRKIFDGPVLISILLLGLGLRLSQLMDPLVDTDSFRQSATASIARNYYDFGYNLFQPRITGWGTINQPGLWPNEFPLYPYIISIFYSLFGIQEWFGRLFTALFSIIGALALFHIVKPLDNENTAKFAALWFLIAPQSIYHSRCFHRHPVAIAFMLIGIALYLYWLRRPDQFVYGCLIATASIALLLMPPLILFALPFLLLHRFYRNRHCWMDWKFLLAIFCILIPPLLWYSWAIQQPHSYSLNSSGRETFRNWTSLAYYGYWWEYDLLRKVWWALWQYTLGPIGLLLGTLGLFFSRQRFAFLPLLWVGIILVYYIIDVHPIAVEMHYIYFFLILPPLSWGAGRSMQYLWEHTNVPSICFGMPLRLLLVFLIVFGTLFHWDKMFRKWYQTKNHYLEAAQTIKTNTNPSHRVIIDVFDPAVMYYSERLGLCKSPQDINLEKLREWERDGATHLAIINQSQFFPKMELRHYLKETAITVEKNVFIRFYELNYKARHLVSENSEEFEHKTIELPNLPPSAEPIEFVYVEMDSKQPPISPLWQQNTPFNEIDWKKYAQQFMISRDVITKAQWFAVMDQSRLDSLRGLNQPITNITWDECQVFVDKLNQLEMGTFRLPYLAELMYVHKHYMDTDVTLDHPSKPKMNTKNLFSFHPNFQEWSKSKWLTPLGKPRNVPSNPVVLAELLSSYAVFQIENQDHYSKSTFEFNIHDTKNHSLGFRVVKLIP